MLALEASGAPSQEEAQGLNPSGPGAASGVTWRTGGGGVAEWGGESNQAPPVIPARLWKHSTCKRRAQLSLGRRRCQPRPL